MDGHQFDTLLRTMARSRRPLLGGLLAAMVGAASRTGPVAGKKKKKKVKLCLNGQALSVKKNKKGSYLAQGATEGNCPANACTTGQKPCQDRCVPSNQCCVDADCAAATPRCCRGACIRSSECCATVDCPVGQACESGVCRCGGEAVTCGAKCCVAPSALAVLRIACEQTGGPRCLCTVLGDDVCQGNCPPGTELDLPCAPPDLDLIDDLCQDAGCGMRLKGCCSLSRFTPAP